MNKKFAKRLFKNKDKHRIDFEDYPEYATKNQFKNNQISLLYKPIK
jgi:hypothetical protein